MKSLGRLGFLPPQPVLPNMILRRVFWPGVVQNAPRNAPTSMWLYQAACGALWWAERGRGSQGIQAV